MAIPELGLGHRAALMAAPGIYGDDCLNRRVIEFRYVDDLARPGLT
ncbi:MAG TPA: hypothetical protein VFQ44_21805 [Streptosporangiaceae bacterium]|nr:hypothetical protein [Streptosporangiaceae bacterium]